MNASIYSAIGEGYAFAVVSAIAKNLKSIRRKLDLTQDRLAELAKIQQSSISDWETGRVEPTVTLLLRVAAALGCSLDDLVVGLNSDYDSTVDLIRHSSTTALASSERRSDVPASGGVDSGAVERAELERALADTREVANRLAGLLEQSGVPAKGRSAAKPPARLRGGHRKTG